MSVKSDKIWLDGKLIPFEDANVHILTHSLHYGLAAFEGIRCYKRADGRRTIFRLREHIERLHRSAKIGGMDLTWSVDEICQACIDTVKANSFEDCYIRPLVFIGDGEMGLAALSNPIRLAIATWKWGNFLGEKGVKGGVRAKVASYARNDVRSSSSKGKISGNYVNSIFAKREVMKSGYEEAILLDTDGYVSEASGENLFAIFNGVVFTTPVGSPIIEGITRYTVMQYLEEGGHPLKEARMTRDMLYCADEIFCVGTAAEVTPIVELDDRPIADGKPGKVTSHVQQRYFDEVRGSADDHLEWHTFVD